MKKWYINAGIFGLINLAIVALIIVYWIPMYNQPSHTFQVGNLYFLFFFAHGTVLWFILQTGWMTYWSFKYFRSRSLKLVSSILILIGALFSLWSMWNLIQYYYAYGQQSSWVRFFNQAAQVELIAVWMSILITPLLILGLILTIKGKKGGASQNSSQTSLKKYWNLGIIAYIVFLLAWGMVLSYRDATLLAQEMMIGSIIQEYSWVAIYNPLSALIALVKSIFQGPLIAAQTTSNLHTIFAHPDLSIPGWPSFFPALFWGKMVLMLIITDLSLGLSWLVKKQLLNN